MEDDFEKLTLSDTIPIDEKEREELWVQISDKFPHIKFYKEIKKFVKTIIYTKYAFKMSHLNYLEDNDWKILKEEATRAGIYRAFIPTLRNMVK